MSIGIRNVALFISLCHSHWTVSFRANGKRDANEILKLYRRRLKNPRAMEALRSIKTHSLCLVQVQKRRKLIFRKPNQRERWKKELENWFRFCGSWISIKCLINVSRRRNLSWGETSGRSRLRLTFQALFSWNHSEIIYVRRLPRKDSKLCLNHMMMMTTIVLRKLNLLMFPFKRSTQKTPMNNKTLSQVSRLYCHVFSNIFAYESLWRHLLSSTHANIFLQISKVSSSHKLREWVNKSIRWTWRDLTHHTWNESEENLLISVSMS